MMIIGLPSQWASFLRRALRIPAHPFSIVAGYEITILSETGFDDAYG
jgi:hypothetical protein